MAEWFVMNCLRMDKITLFVRADCPYCVNAVQIVKSRAPGRMQVVDITGFPNVQEYLQQTLWRNVPFVYFGNTYFGGLSELQRMYQRIPMMLQYSHGM
ncbi:PREDICTED: glutaredoxin-1-like, partial [Merops nubicus]|uniref:glutaredoxin-1-like n=1 Tax=Merops nubicus TaxID=57421 RepID=UPI0004F0A8B3